jgi:hypothetical protein
VAQNSFAGFFLLVLCCGVALLVRMAWRGYPRIVRALFGTPPSRQAARQYRLRRLRTADLPRVARRLQLDCPGDLRPSAGPARIWAYQRQDPAA